MSLYKGANPIRRALLSSEPNYLLKAPPPNTITLAYECGGDTDTDSIPSLYSVESQGSFGEEYSASCYKIFFIFFILNVRYGMSTLLTNWTFLFYTHATSPAFTLLKITVIYNYTSSKETRMPTQSQSQMHIWKVACRFQSSSSVLYISHYGYKPVSPLLGSGICTISLQNTFFLLSFSVAETRPPFHGYCKYAPCLESRKAKGRETEQAILPSRPPPAPPTTLCLID